MFELFKLGILIISMSDGAFIEEPFNVTVAEGESMKFNCSMGVISEDIATWVINGLEFYWSDFLSIEVYTFDLQDNSLVIHNSPRSLDGNSYQCILDNRRSRIGYLSVLYMSPTPPTKANSSSDCYSSIDKTATSTSLPMLPVTTSTTESTTFSSSNSIIAIATTGTAVFFLLTVVCSLLVLCRLRHSCTSKFEISTGVPQTNDDLNMDLFAQTLTTKIVRNTVYIPTPHFSRSP